MPVPVVVPDVTTVPGTTTDQLDPAVGTTPTTNDLPPLTVWDRCDSAGCSAQAYVRARLVGGLELVFCGHHGRDLVPALVGRGASVRDDTHLLAAEGAR